MTSIMPKALVTGLLQILRSMPGAAGTIPTKSAADLIKVIEKQWPTLTPKQQKQFIDLVTKQQFTPPGFEPTPEQRQIIESVSHGLSEISFIPKSQPPTVSGSNAAGLIPNGAVNPHIINEIATGKPLSVAQQRQLPKVIPAKDPIYSTSSYIKSLLEGVTSSTEAEAKALHNLSKALEDAQHAKTNRGVEGALKRVANAEKQIPSLPAANTKKVVEMAANAIENASKKEAKEILQQVEEYKQALEKKADAEKNVLLAGINAALIELSQNKPSGPKPVKKPVINIQPLRKVSNLIKLYNKTKKAPINTTINEANQAIMQINKERAAGLANREFALRELPDNFHITTRENPPSPFITPEQKIGLTKQILSQPVQLTQGPATLRNLAETGVAPNLAKGFKKADNYKKWMSELPARRKSNLNIIPKGLVRNMTRRIEKRNFNGKDSQALLAATALGLGAAAASNSENENEEQQLLGEPPVATPTAAEQRRLRAAAANRRASGTEAPPVLEPVVEPVINQTARNAAAEQRRLRATAAANAANRRASGTEVPSVLEPVVEPVINQTALNAAAEQRRLRATAAANAANRRTIQNATRRMKQQRANEIAAIANEPYGLGGLFGQNNESSVPLLARSNANASRHLPVNTALPVVTAPVVTAPRIANEENLYGNNTYSPPQVTYDPTVQTNENLMRHAQRFTEGTHAKQLAKNELTRRGIQYVEPPSLNRGIFLVNTNGRLINPRLTNEELQTIALPIGTSSPTLLARTNSASSRLISGANSRMNTTPLAINPLAQPTNMASLVQRPVITGNISAAPGGGTGLTGAAVLGPQGGIGAGTDATQGGPRAALNAPPLSRHPVLTPPVLTGGPGAALNEEEDNDEDAPDAANNGAATNPPEGGTGAAIVAPDAVNNGAATNPPEGGTGAANNGAATNPPGGAPGGAPGGTNPFNADAAATAATVVTNEQRRAAGLIVNAPNINPFGPARIRPIEIDIIRHAFSCGNLAKSTPTPKRGFFNFSGKKSNFEKVLERKKTEGLDHILSNTGIMQAIGLRNRYKATSADFKYEIVFTSYLRRAIETAIIAFAPKATVEKFFSTIFNTRDKKSIIVDLGTKNVDTIKVMPYLSEKKTRGVSFIGLGEKYDGENYSVGLEKLKEYFRTIEEHPGGRPFIDYSYIYRYDKNTETEYEPRFINHIVEELMPIAGDRSRYKFAIVTHSNAMREMEKNTIKGLKPTWPLLPELQKAKRPFNTEIYPTLFNLNQPVHVEWNHRDRIRSPEYFIPNIRDIIYQPIPIGQVHLYGARCRWIQERKFGGTRRKRYNRRTKRRKGVRRTHKKNH